MDFLDKARNYMQNIVRNVTETVLELEPTKDGEAPDGEVKKVEVVQLNVYDLRKKKLPEVIWHTGIVIYGIEYYYNKDGIMICEPGKHPSDWTETRILGTTEINKEEFEKCLEVLMNGEFKASKYNLVRRNCNHFSKIVCEFLFGSNLLPDYVTEIMNADPKKLSGKVCESIAKNSKIVGRMGFLDDLFKWTLSKIIQFKLEKVVVISSGRGFEVNTTESSTSLASNAKPFRPAGALTLNNKNN